MMRKFFSLMLMAVAAMSVSAQNVQLHYDFGRNIYSNEEAGRQKVTLTLEQFKADKWGSWFYFVDLDLNRKETMATLCRRQAIRNVYKSASRSFLYFTGKAVSG